MVEKSSLDSSFITDKLSKNLKDRFEQLIKDCRFFDFIGNYFYMKGFYNLYKALENIERIKILIRIRTSKRICVLIKITVEETSFLIQRQKKYIKNVESKMTNSEDKLYIMTFKEEDRGRGRLLMVQPIENMRLGDYIELKYIVNLHRS